VTDGPDIVWYFASARTWRRRRSRAGAGIAYRRAVPARVPGWRLVLDKPGIVPVGHGFANIVPDDAAPCCASFTRSVRRARPPRFTEGVLNRELPASRGRRRDPDFTRDEGRCAGVRVGPARRLSPPVPPAISRVSSPARSSTGCPPRTSSAFRARARVRGKRETVASALSRRRAPAPALKPSPAMDPAADHCAPRWRARGSHQRHGNRAVSSPRGAGRGLASARARASLAGRSDASVRGRWPRARSAAARARIPRPRAPARGRSSSGDHPRIHPQGASAPPQGLRIDRQQRLM